MRKAVITDHSFETPVRYGIGVDNVDLAAAERKGTLVDTADLVAALRSGKLAGAALDVTDPEPIDPVHPLVAMENVPITSHVASVREPAGRTLRTSVATPWPPRSGVRGSRNVVNGVSA